MTKNEKGQVEFINLSGKRFGNVVVTNYFEKQPNGGVKWRVMCLCEKHTEWLVWAEVLGRNPSIRCRECRNEVLKETQRARIGSFARDDWPGGSPLIKALRARAGAIQRCENPKATGYQRYGGRGIKVCSGLHDAKAFVKIIGLPPHPSSSLGRKNNDGNYSCGQCPECKQNGWPRNVFWEDAFTQCNNRSTNRFIEFNGKRNSVTSLAIKCGLSPYALFARLKKGMPINALLCKNNVDRGDVLFYSFNC